MNTSTSTWKIISRKPTGNWQKHSCTTKARIRVHTESGKKEGEVIRLRSVPQKVAQRKREITQEQRSSLGGDWFEPHISALVLGSDKGKTSPLAGWRVRGNERRAMGKPGLSSWGTCMLLAYSWNRAEKADCTGDWLVSWVTDRPSRHHSLGQGNTPAPLTSLQSSTLEWGVRKGLRTEDWGLRREFSHQIQRLLHPIVVSEHSGGSPYWHLHWHLYMILIKYSWHFFTELEQVILNLYGTTKDPKLPKQS